MSEITILLTFIIYLAVLIILAKRFRYITCQGPKDASEGYSLFPSPHLHAQS